MVKSDRIEKIYFTESSDLSESTGQKLINPTSEQWRKSYKLPRPITIFDLWKNLLFMLMTARVSVRLDSELKALSMFDYSDLIQLK